MAVTSSQLPLGTVAPNFELTDTVSGNRFRLESGLHTATIIVFICNHCPSVLHMIDHFAAFAQHIQKRGVQVVAISSNNIVAYPQDAPDRMREFAQQHDFSFPYLFDESQDVARAYMAACTPDLYVFDANLVCVYRGRYDDSTPGNGVPVTGADLSDAVESLLNGQPVNPTQLPGLGCSIKWKTL